MRWGRLGGPNGAGCALCGAEMVLGQAVGHAKSGPTTIKLHVGAHWHLSENVEAWLDLLETSVAARI